MKKGTRVLLAIAGLGCCVLPALGQFPTNLPEGPRNVLTSQEQAEGWRLLFNGTDLTGWSFDQGKWRVEDGIIISEEGPGHLFTEERYQNFELSWDLCAYDAAVPKRRFGNSGVFLRAVKTGQNFPRGYEVQVDPYDRRNPTGGVYGMAPGTLLVDAEGNWKPEAFFDVHEGKWIRQRARIVGNRITVWVNGQKTLEWEDPENRFPEAGYIALQNHHKSDVVLFMNIKIRVLE